MDSQLSGGRKSLQDKKKWLLFLLLTIVTELAIAEGVLYSW